MTRGVIAARWARAHGESSRHQRRERYAAPDFLQLLEQLGIGERLMSTRAQRVRCAVA